MWGDKVAADFIYDRPRQQQARDVAAHAYAAPPTFLSTPPHPPAPSTHTHVVQQIAAKGGTQSWPA